MIKTQIKVLCCLIIFILFHLTGIGQESNNDKISALIDHINAGLYPNIDAVVVAKNNEILIEAYFNGFKKDSLHDMRSSFKSVTSLLAGIAIDKGLFNVNDEVQKFIPEWKNDPRGKITVKNLLEMKSGLACEGFFGIGPDCESEMWETKDWVKYILNIPAQHDPGTNWAYSSVEPELVGIIISRTSGMTLMEFAKTHLFTPLDITSYQWYLTPNGGGYAAGSFYMKPLDMLKVAQLVLNNGNWNGREIVNKKWIQEATRCETDVEMSFMRFARTNNAKYTTANYGYLWYRESLQFKDIHTEVLFASGNGGQYMMILEDYDAVVAFTGGNYGNWIGKLPFDMLVKYIIPIVESNN